MAKAAATTPVQAFQDPHEQLFGKAAHSEDDLYLEDSAV